MKDITYKTEFLYSVTRDGTWGAGGSKIKLYEHGHVAYQIKGDDK